MFIYEGTDPTADGGEAGETLSIEVRLHYLEHGKPVQVGLLRIPNHWEAQVELLYLQYDDLYGNVQRLGHTRGFEVVHGRLVCVYKDGEATSLPMAG